MQTYGFGYGNSELDGTWSLHGDVLDVRPFAQLPSGQFTFLQLDSSGNLMVTGGSGGGGGGTAASGPGVDKSNAAASALTVLQTFTVTNAGQYYVQNQSAAPIQVIFSDGMGGTPTIVLLASGGSAGAQGADTAPAMSWFTGQIKVAGASGAQFAARHN